jgi:hypothetical protein
MDYVSPTSAVDPTVNWAQYAPYEPSLRTGLEALTHTPFVNPSIKPFEFFIQSVGVDAPTSLHYKGSAKRSSQAPSISDFISSSKQPAVDLGVDIELDKIAKQRVKLMAAKYASNGASAEIIARLEIFSHRLLERSPRVTQSQVHALENADENLFRIRKLREERAKRLGISE